jgi:hypothetical protein
MLHPRTSVRFDHLAIGPRDDPATIRFHPKLTVVSGMGAPERTEMLDLMVGALTGSGPDVREAAWVDGRGGRFRLISDTTGARFVGEDGAEVPAPLALLGLDVAELRRLMLIQATHVGADPAEAGGDQQELADARATLAAIEAELSVALGERASLDALRAEVAAIDEQLQQAEEGGARRRYARLLGELQRVRVEADSVRGGEVKADADRRFITAAADVDQSARRWRELARQAEQQRVGFGTRERLDPRTLAEALATPDQVPPELDRLAAAYEQAEAHRAELADRLNALATDHLAEPSHPAIVRLAHADQDVVWGGARRAIDAESRLEGQSVALGGLEAEGVAPSAVADLEDAHDTVDRAERVVDDRFVPGSVAMVVGVLFAVIGALITPLITLGGVVVILLAGLWALALPHRALTAARQQEQEALRRTGVLSYIGFQLRRLEVTINPAATEPLELAALEYRRAMTFWRRLAGDLSPADALPLEDETRAYAAAVAGLRGAADQIAEVRHQLVDEAEPAGARAKRELLKACAPFGIEDPSLAVELVRHQARTSSHARLQQALEAAEAAETEVALALGRHLDDLGFAEGELADRLAGFDASRGDAIRRDQARADARPSDVVEAELARLEALARSEHRPEWGEDVTPAEAEEPDVDALRARRQEVMAEFTDARRQTPDVERLTDRRDTLVRRVGVLEGGHTHHPAPSIDADDLEQRLLARLAAARRVGPAAETVPLVLSEPFEHLHGDRKWSILQVVERLSATVQLVYLTDDVDVIVWARRLAANGAISLLEPTAELA